MLTEPNLPKETNQSNTKFNFNTVILVKAVNAWVCIAFGNVWDLCIWQSSGPLFMALTEIGFWRTAVLSNNAQDCKINQKTTIFAASYSVYIHTYSINRIEYKFFAKKSLWKAKVGKMFVRLKYEKFLEVCKTQNGPRGQDCYFLPKSFASVSLKPP